MTSPTERLDAFAYVHADKAPVYRAVMRAFVDARGRFVLHLRPRDVAEELARADPPVRTEDGDVDAVLVQLAKWGNLESHPDTDEVTTVEDFYRKRVLYQLTLAGEAAERALAVFYETLRQPGELQTAALADVHALLEELDHLAAADELDEGKVHRTLRALRQRFDELTAKAQAFIGSLQRTIDLHGVTVEQFLAYKEVLIDYLERFIGELVMATSNIAEALRRIETRGVDRLLVVAGRRDLADALDPTDADRAAAVDAWRGRWRGLRAWFVGEGRASQAEILRARARSAIPSLLAAAAGIHDRRVTRSDRTTDLRTLARWFAELDDDRDAHRLWRAAFGLSPARHLTVDAETLEERDLEPVSPQTSWREAPPLSISPRLRKSGRYRRRGRPEGVIDRSKEKRLLAELAAAEAEQIAAARDRLATGRRTRLSEIGTLEPTEFQLFLDLLGESLAAQVGPETAVAASSDGSLQVVLEPTGDGATATIRTSEGRFSGADHFITVREVFGDRQAEPALRERRVEPALQERR
jgi:uncharacterized protein (TIGR02677 family)